MRHALVSSLSVLALAAGATGYLAPAATAHVAERPVPSPAPTPFAMGASGYGSTARGGEVPAGSDPVSWQSMGCSNRVGRENENHLDAATLPGAGDLADVVTRTWTTSRDGIVAAHTSTAIAHAVLGSTETGTIEIDNLRSQFDAFHDGTGFGARPSTAVGALRYVAPDGQVQELAPPTAAEPVVVPGVAKIAVGGSGKTVDGDGAAGWVETLKVELLASGTTVRLGHAHATISDGVRSGLFQGRSAGLASALVDGHVSLGSQPLSVMPCQGTDGELLTRALAHADPADNVVLRGVSSRQESDQTRWVASGFERGRVDAVDINDGQLLIHNVVGRANVTRTADGLVRNAKGTSVGTVTYQGQEQEFPESGVLEIPGVAKLERELVSRTEHGITVTALRVTLLDGSGLVLNLGHATLSVAGAGL